MSRAAQIHPNRRGLGVGDDQRSHRPRNLRGERQRKKLRAVAERDKWVCQLCWGPVPREPDATGSNPRRASLDHIHPLSEGGSNDLENLRLTHAECNTHRHWLEAA